MQSTHKSSLPALTLGALGVVYGDIGTSVLYSMKEVFGTGHVAFTPDNVYGILSLFVWTLTIIVSLKYVTLVLRADNKGEGGLIAMLALASNAVKDNPRRHRWIMLMGVFGTCLFYGDGVITPAISVLSAVEGLTVINHEFQEYVLPMTLGILAGLFFVQRYGTTDIGKAFGPIMLLWFVCIAALGLWHIVQNPGVLKALSPWYALHFIAEAPGIAFIILGAVVLCVTGAEALYADMGHFGKTPIRLAWFLGVMPALVLNYFGQGALLLAQPAAQANPFFMLIPAQWGDAPQFALVALATAATTIASQALITGAFSTTTQVVQLGYLPRMRVIYTNVRELGQIYMPFVNWTLFTAIVLAVVIFKSSSALAAAYGIAVTTNMLITTILTFFVLRFAWKMPLPLTLFATGFFFWIDFAFWSSNLLKFFHGGWFPIVIGAFVFTLLLTWKDGRERLSNARKQDALGLRGFLDGVFLSPPQRVDGTAVFLCPEDDIVPSALLHNLKHNKVLHEVNLFVGVRSHETPWIGLSQRLQISAMGHNCWQVTLNYGFKNQIDVPEALSHLKGHGFEFDPMQTSYFVSREVVAPTQAPGMMGWRKKLFAHMHHNASTAAEFMHLPSNAVVELGAKVDI
jgi:KUP system potassium uptake protein